MLADLLLMYGAKSAESQLPWKDGKSDAEILELKQKALSCGKRLYDKMGQKDDVMIIDEYIVAV